MAMNGKALSSFYPVTSTFLPDYLFCPRVEKLPQKIRSTPELLKTLPFLDELAEIELRVHLLHQAPPPLPDNIEVWQLRPGVELLEASWSGLVELLNGADTSPFRQNSFVLVIPGEGDKPPSVTVPDKRCLLALKIVVEELDLLRTARECKTSVRHLQDILLYATQKGILLHPKSKIVRPKHFSLNSKVDSRFLSAEVFTLQWHITQNCDLRCLHCYDRSDRQDVSLKQGRNILDQLYDFCKQQNVLGQVSFSGGNPILHPDFYNLYQEAAERGFMIGILGNPIGRQQLERLLSIHPPEFYQVSLEGLEKHNDSIRGSGHFNRTMHFLSLLKDLDIYSMVMLTLTQANLEQVLPLAEMLNDSADLFTFNRLAMVGEGASLVSVSPKDYENFLKAYLEAAKTHPVMRLKDNLFNILKLHQGSELGGGCAGHGCGAAFNFISLLSDGEVHACRKLPSLIGNIYKNTLAEIYQDDIALRYRQGCRGCLHCEIKPVCGGCPAVTNGFGGNFSADVDPYCFL
ncbi:MAG: thio(seleno)oxazole modification radical SAM maturase SbtM [Desulforhopalus sp.]